MHGTARSRALVAVLCVTALGVSATTLESSLATDPADAIDVDYDPVPFDESDVAEVVREVEADAGGAADDAAASTPRSGADGGADGQRWPDLLAVLVRAALALAVLVLVALAVRYRERLLGRLPAGGAATAGRADPRADPWPPVEPASAVDRAWLAMVRRAGIDRPGPMTTAECAAAAREAGLDPAAVEAVTDAFERVHYGGAAPDAEADRALAALDRLDGPPIADGGPGSRARRGDAGADRDANGGVGER